MYRRLIWFVCLNGLLANPALGKVTPQEATELGGPKLTAFGAEKAGNADGSIPAYTGGLKQSAGNANGGIPPDPYAGDRVLYTVNSSNIGRYQSLLTAGTAAAIRQYPTFHVDVYPTHRSVYYPKWVLDNTLKNATTAELVGASQGDGIANAYGGVPFPIPKSGAEIMWNHELRWDGVSTRGENGGGYFVDAVGHRTLTNLTETVSGNYFYLPGRANLADKYFQKIFTRNSAPASQDGSADIIDFPINYADDDQLIYIYTIGQRRVRLAPNFKYDTPIAQASGAYLYDEIGLFAGRPDKFDFKIIGKKEILVPYNLFKLNERTSSLEAVFTPHHLNPDYVRWEKHRVWVVDATLKPGKRHVYSRRTFYADEDSWAFLASDSYDQAGGLYRVGYLLTLPIYNVEDASNWSNSFVFMNIVQGSYAVANWFGGGTGGRISMLSSIPSASLYSPEVMAGSGLR